MHAAWRRARNVGMLFCGARRPPDPEGVMLSALFAGVLRPQTPDEGNPRRFPLGV